MTWQLFAVIQIAAFSAAAIAALWLRNARLRREVDDLTGLCASAQQSLAEVTGKLAEIDFMAPPEKLLEERTRALSANDPTTTVRRLVLENEISPRADFADTLAEHLAAQQEPEEEEAFVRRWKSLREECHQLSLFLVADQPECLDPLRQIFDVFEPMDRQYGTSFDLMELEQAARGEAVAPGPAADAAAAAAGDEIDQDELDQLLADAQGAGDDQTAPGS